MGRTALKELPPIRVYTLLLEDDASPDKHRRYVRLPPPIDPYVLRLVIAAGSTASRNGVFHTNYPLDGSPFQRDKYHSKILPKTFSTPITIDIVVKVSGVFTYYIEYDYVSPHERLTKKKSTPGYFNVDPILKLPQRTPILNTDTNKLEPIGIGGKVIPDSTCSLPLDGLVIQSINAASMGTLSNWKPHLDTTRDRGYNCIHFVPLQQRGGSYSPYSILDQQVFADFLFDKPPKSNDQRNKLVADMIDKIRKDWGMLSIIDVVYNHTSSDSTWLQDHPEAGYNISNSPHLKPALELEDALLSLSSSLKSRGLPTVLESEQDLSIIMNVIKNETLQQLKLWQFYAIDVQDNIDLFEEEWVNSSLKSIEESNELQGHNDDEAANKFITLCLPNDWDHIYDRNHVLINVQESVKFISNLLQIEPDSSNVSQASQKLRRLLDIINDPRYVMYDDDIKAILKNTYSRIFYTRLDPNGPNLGPITESTPLIEPLFTKLPLNKTTKKHDPGSLALANNGWIWNADPLLDFASSKSRAYLRRDVIVWSDCVKLRYGTGPNDSPFLWEHMAQYTKLLAKVFNGFRIDNCHSTPIHVGEYFLDTARKVNPNLYVCAELFTGSEELDIYFVKRLGINSLIREAMNGNDPKDQSSLLYRYGVTNPVGSMDEDCLLEEISIEFEGKKRIGYAAPHQGSVPHAFMMDCTHDNPSPADKRTAQDALSTGVLVPFTRAAIGSNKGFDDLYPKHVNVVDRRLYEVYPSGDSNGIGLAKRIVNHLHTEMALGSYIETHFSQEGQYISSHRVNPLTNDGYFVIAHTGFNPSDTKSRGYVSPIKLYETKMTFVWGASLSINGLPTQTDDKTLHGFDANLMSIKPVSAVEKSDEQGVFSEVVVPDNFPPGSVLLYKTKNNKINTEATDFIKKDADKAMSKLELTDLNVVLYRTDGEERDVTNGNEGSYFVSGLGPLTYCGLEGFMVHLLYIIRFNDLGHPLCNHLRSGTWAFDYLHGRLEKQAVYHPRLNEVAQWFKQRTDIIKENVPPFLRPRFFAILVNAAYKAARARSISLMSSLIRNGPSLTRDLAMCSVQFYGLVLSASLDPGKPVPSQAAGLPHFASGWARVWGRDCAIASRIFITTGQFDAARQHILALASTLKHGLIPNLIDSIRTPRYNSRDSPWFFLQLVQDYVERSSEGVKFLDVTVKRRFPLDDTWVPWDHERAYSYESTIKDIVLEILQRHANGIHFREYNAGPNLDQQMRDEGFNIDIDVDWHTGFIHGGNAFNCGTWMDKNGESEKAGTKGLPGTPRDGAPVEITGLLKSTLRWLTHMYKKGIIKERGVQILKEEKLVTFEEWNNLIQKSFEKYYYVPLSPVKDSSHVINPDLVARRGIYKDVYGSGKGRERSDYQLRANFPIAMTVAPELFTKESAQHALEIYAQTLVKQLGVATLDPRDPDYRPNYNNSEDSDDFLTAKGRNYHQGPEWVWPLGYFLRAFLLFKRKSDYIDEDLLYQIHSFLKGHRFEIETSLWRGLPELTNENGSYCSDSCRTQAWSASTLLDVLDDIYREEGLSK